MSDPEIPVTATGENEEEASEDTFKEDDIERRRESSVVETSAKQGQTSSVHLSRSKTQSEEQLNPEDVKKAITFSPSITEAVNNTVQPLRDFNILQVPKDDQQTILLKASQRVKDDFTEARALSELSKMFDLYKSSLVDNSILEAQCHELQDKLRQYEARHHWDPRVLKVLLIAEKCRQEKAIVYDEKSELESEVIDMTIEMKHMEDMLKNKNKDLQKLHEDLKKIKELEKQVEYSETIIMKKDNEKRALQSQLDALNANIASDPNRQSHIVSDDGKSMYLERDMQARIDQLLGEKTALKSEADDKTKQLHIAQNKLSTLKVENSELENLRRDNVKVMSKLQSENMRVQSNFSSLEKKMATMRDQLTTAKSEIIALNKTLEACEQGNTDVTKLLAAKRKESEAFQRKLFASQQRVVTMKDEQKLCEESNNILRQETKTKDLDLVVGQKLLSDKRSECESLSTKVSKLDALKVKHLELLKLTNLNAAQMVREISELRAGLASEKNQLARAEGNVSCMQTQIESLQREYLAVLEKNFLLVRNQEMASATIEKFEQSKVATARHMAHLMKTNIDLYTQTRSQQEIALIQSHQFHLKENEIKGLLSRLEEEDSKMERMLVRDKEKRCAIEQLHAEANVKDQKIKLLKSNIESSNQLNKSLSDKAEELCAQLRQVQTQRELIRRQRDLFGTKLLQSRAETDLCVEKLRCATDRMTKYSVDFYNTLNDSSILKLEIKNLRRKNKLLEGQVEVVQTLRQELGQACKALEVQKSKNVILEATKMPNLHRWRGLLASDPSKYEMVLKNQLLIRRLIVKTKEVAGLEELLKQKDVMYMSLRVLVQRRVNINLAPEMSSAKGLIRKQHRQLKSLTAELNMVNDDARLTKAKEQQHKEKLNEMVLVQAREKAAKLRANKKQELPPLSTIPHLPDVHKARQ